MKLDALKATGIELTDAIRAAVDHTLGQLARIADQFGESVSAHVEVGKSTRHHKKGPYFRAEINLKIPRHLLRAEAEEETLYAAIEAVENTLQIELKKAKGKLLNRKKSRKGQ
jgi:ribosomal subunit interface protein